MDWRDPITVDPLVCHGRAGIRGTRVPVSVVLDNLAAGLSAEDVAQSYPSVSVDAVRAALAYAASRPTCVPSSLPGGPFERVSGD